MKLAGKVALITGANRGIGRGCALEMAREGSAIIVNFRSHREEAESVAAEVEDLGQKAFCLQADVSKRDQVDAMVEESLREFGKVDFLINNAVSSVRKPFVDLTEEDLAFTWGSALWGPFHCSQSLVRKWISRNERGKIVMISSVHAAIPFPGALPYNTAKAGLNHMACTLATELLPYKINVNVVEPGWIDTPGERALLPDGEIQKRAPRLPWGRLGTAEEIGKAVVFLCSDDAEYVTGSTFRVDGGFWLPANTVSSVAT